MTTTENVTYWFYLQKVSQRCIFKVRKFQLDTLSGVRMVEEKREGASPPPGKIGLTGKQGLQRINMVRIS